MRRLVGGVILFFVLFVLFFSCSSKQDPNYLRYKEGKIKAQQQEANKALRVLDSE